jgi:hypothetical protein
LEKARRRWPRPGQPSHDTAEAKGLYKAAGLPHPAEQQPKLAGVSVLALEALGVGPGLNVGKAVMAGLVLVEPGHDRKTEYYLTL